MSIFEPHTDIIIKDRRETYYGHKVCLTSGASGMILDLVVEDCKPRGLDARYENDSRVIGLLGRAPRQAAFDGGFSSQANVRDIKDLGVEDVVFSKHVGLEIADMARSESRPGSLGKDLLAQTRVRAHAMYVERRSRV